MRVVFIEYRISNFLFQIKPWQRLCEILEVMNDTARASKSNVVPSQEEEQLAAYSAAKCKIHTLPPDVIPFEYQVAGHGADDGKDNIGILHHKDGYVLKPMEKLEKEKCEVKFYEDLQTATDLESIELRKFVPKYMGTASYDINGKAVKFIILDNITKSFVEPSIMDIKIGRQTWDPEASSEKRAAEDKKYICKQDLGFCIPGFQVYRIATGKVTKLGKEYGKKLNKHTIRDALRLFLNADSGVSRKMMLQFLAHLWQILLWCRTQKKFRFYSSSLLLAYDTRRLRQCLKSEGYSPSRPLSPILDRALNISSLPIFTPTVGSAYGYRACSPAHFTFCDHLSLNKDMSDGRHSPSSPLVPSSPAALAVYHSNSNSFGEDSWHAEFEKACRTHSLVNNYERDLKSIKESYTFQLDDLKGTDNPENKDDWVKVKMIDFAHVFPAVNDEVDTNYLEGMESLVKIFESILHESQFARV